MILPIPGGVTSSVPVSVLALNADARPDGCHGNRFRVPAGAFVAFQLVCDVECLAGDTVQGFLLLGLWLWRLLLSRRQKKVCCSMFAQRAETTMVKKKKSFIGLGFIFFSGG